MQRVIKFLKAKPELMVYVFFFLAASFLALRVKLGVAPDENYHYGFIQYYGKHSIDPFMSHQTSNFNLGELTREPSYLYHYLLSFIYRIGFALNLNTVDVLRFANIFMGLGTLIGLNKLGKILKLDSLTRFTLLFLIANIPMFLFLSASINYDNLVILLSTIGVLQMISMIKNPRVSTGFYLLIIMMAGPIVKFSFAPVSLVLFIFTFYVTIKNWKKLWTDFLRIYKKHIKILAAGFVCLIIFFGLFSERYILNEFDYHQYDPPCNKVLSEGQCQQSAIYVRQEGYDKKGSQNVHIRKDIYAVNWLSIMNNRIYGILGHQKFLNSSKITYTGLALFYILLLLFIRKFTFGKNVSDLVIPVTFFIYTLALIYANMKSYKFTGDILFAVQGRYWFPALFPFVFYVVGLWNKELSRHKATRYVLAIVLIAFAFISGLPNILHGSNPAWFN